jgi:hypothetical protein
VSELPRPPKKPKGKKVKGRFSYVSGERIIISGESELFLINTKTKEIQQ